MDKIAANEVLAFNELKAAVATAKANGATDARIITTLVYLLASATADNDAFDKLHGEHVMFLTALKA